jgi:malonyl-CoA reductase/3-hydroxypropionate dehydrogenase (NADP+)
MAKYGRIDIVVNNAGSAGPRQKLENVPISRADLEALRAAGSADSETAGDAARNLLGVTWNVARAAAKVLQPGAAMINISTIFSRTQYFGRTAYVVPKAALNAVSHQLAAELGNLGIRVNSIFPGPIESERIRTVFAAMDKLREEDAGTTASDFFGLMSLARAYPGRAPERTFPTVLDVANVVVFLASDESGALNGHDLEVTHGMAVAKESRSTWLSRPSLRNVDGMGRTVLIAGGEQVADALAIARIQAGTGAKVLVGLAREDDVRAAAASLRTGLDARITVVHVNRTMPETLTRVLEASESRVDAAIILPASPPGQLRGPMKDALDADVDVFIDREIVGAIALSRELSRYWQTARGAGRGPRIVFISNADDGAGNVYSHALLSAIEELCRVWRHESEARKKTNPNHHREWSNQLVRFTNKEAEGLAFVAQQAARVLFTPRHIEPVNLYLPASIVDATGAKRGALGFMDNLTGLHLGKVALVTGGSAGIGGQIGRLLASAGARVMLVSRGVAQLQEMRDRIVREMEDCGYSGAASRVQTLAGIDVADLAAAERAVDVTLETFGRIDYLINCAGVAGAEEMVVDMAVDDFRHTLDANLVSNYALIQKVVPHMKAQGSGYIVNVSSYFGGEKYVATPYPNRADYAVSKAGQRALAENLARVLGPEIQINAIAPGPVAGDRLKGTGGKPGLYERRARLIVENKRLNRIHAALVSSIRAGAKAGDLLDLLAKNQVEALAEAPEPLQKLAASLAREGKGGASCGRFLLTRHIAAKLVERVRGAGYLAAEGEQAERFSAAWVEALPEPPLPFFANVDIEAAAAKIREDVLSLLHLKRMPTEMEVALATVFYLADRAVSGETFMPSGGLSLERSITERELFGSVKPERLEQMKGQTVWIVGEHLLAYMKGAATVLVERAHVGRVVVLVRTSGAADALRADLPAAILERCEMRVTGDALEDAMDEARRLFGSPNTIISTAYAPVPDRIFDARASVQPLDTAGFRSLIETNITHHFRVARKAALFDHVQLILVSPDIPASASSEAFALANFVKTTLHALTGTLAVECERLVHDAVVNQINLTRRVRSEEPRDDAESAEELLRFGRAVLLAGAPLPSLEDSRYRSRIYRGMAITV